LWGFFTLALYFRHESYIDVEIQQRAVEYFELSKKGAALADVLAEMPKFPEREVTTYPVYLCSQICWLYSLLFNSFYYSRKASVLISNYLFACQI
jgi:hypothetical protein